MNEIFNKRFFTQFTTTQLYLIVGNFLLVFFLIFLSNLGILPIKKLSDFLFFTFLFLFFALYRPGWAFLIFIGAIVLEDISLAPVGIGISVRPYQFLGALVILAILIRLVAKRLNFSLEKPKWYDFLVILIAASGFISALGSVNRVLSFKLSLVFVSFAALYLLIRNYIRDIADLKKTIPFFVSSSAVIVLYGIWQNIRFARGLISYEVMPGRPNSTFAEADWLGIYLVLLISIIYAIIFYARNKSVVVESKFKVQSAGRRTKLFFLYIFLVLSFTLLIITVSRSTWLGVLAATLVFLFLILTELKITPKNWRWKEFFWNSFGILISGIIAILMVYFFNLTSFQLFNRAQSTGTGLQKITISCVPGFEAPERISTVEQLEKFGCRHINLEDIEAEIGKNNIVKEIYRDDPNINIRKEIYLKSWEQIKNNPILGIGWGSIGTILGADERPARIATPARSDAMSSGEQSVAGGGASLNASNIFLEMWLGAGLLGIVVFLFLWIYILFRNIAILIKAKDPDEYAFSIFIIVAWFGLTAVNLFNSGIMLGFLWLFMAISLIERSGHSTE